MIEYRRIDDVYVLGICSVLTTDICCRVLLGPRRSSSGFLFHSPSFFGCCRLLVASPVRRYEARDSGVSKDSSLVGRLLGGCNYRRRRRRIKSSLTRHAMTGNLYGFQRDRTVSYHALNLRTWPPCMDQHACPLGLYRLRFYAVSYVRPFIR